MTERLSPSGCNRLTLGYATNSEAFSERQYTPSDIEGSEDAQIRESSVFTPFSESPFEFRDLFDDQYDAPANDVREHSMPNVGAGNARNFLHHPGNPSSSANSADQRFSGFNGPTAGAESSQADTQLLERGRGDWQPPSELPPQYNSLLRPSICGRQTEPMQVQVRSTHYAPFGGVFRDVKSASDYRKVATRFNRIPYRPPDGDPSIEALANDRQAQVKRIYDAMTRSDVAKDNKKSIAMRRWVDTAHYPSELVEAYAHKVFDRLLEQARDGFRGWNHNDYASDDRKGEPEDKDVSCAERLDNIIRGLEEEKTICEDVMTSACQIRMFVNAPRAYARRKEANRHGNSKRGKAIPTNPERNLRGTKSRRINPRQVTRLRQATPSVPTPLSNEHVLRDIEPNSHNPMPQPPYYNTGRAHPAEAPRQIPIMAHSDDRTFSSLSPSIYPPPTMSPPQPHANIPRFTPMSSLHQTTFMDPPQTSHGSLPITADEQSCLNNAVRSSWPPTDNFGNNAHYPFPQENAGLGLNSWSFDSPSQRASGSAPPFAETPLHGLPHSLQKDFLDPNDLNIDPSFRDFWDTQDNVQAFPQTHIGQNEQK